MTKHETAALYRAIDLLDQLAPGLDDRRRGLLLRVREQLEDMLGEKEPDGREKIGSLYSGEQWDWVVERYLEGYTIAELARFISVSNSTMSSQLSLMGVPRRGRMGRPTQEEKPLSSLEDRKREFYALV